VGVSLQAFNIHHTNFEMEVRYKPSGMEQQVNRKLLTKDSQEQMT